MKKIVLTAALYLGLGAGIAFAQTPLPTDPWANQGNPWAKTGAAPTERVSTPWNGTYYYPQPPKDKYIGRKTTWNTAMGQVEEAPEVNIHNLLVMSDHLRSLGYKIPPGFDDFMKAAPANLHCKIMSSLQAISISQGDPITRSTSSFIEFFETESGFEIKNLLETSLQILGK